ncbi:MAG: TonB-dependent receptor [Pseudomonadales bacterium]
MPNQMGRACALTENLAFTLWQSVGRSFLLALIILLGSLSQAVSYADEGQLIAFDIEAGPANRTLHEYARQANIEVGFSPDDVSQSRTNRLTGRFNVREGLDLLLKGSDLIARGSDDGVFVSRVTAARSPARDDRADTPRPPANSAARLDEVIVTGTQIRNTAPAGVSVITLDRSYIEQTGLPTTQQVLQTIPQTSGGGANEGEQSVGIGAGTMNRGYSSSVNLRGLGTDSTLLLLNGRRSAPGGGRGDFVDLNSIPTAAIERIEVLPDGASAIYGSDAIGGVINVILRDDYNGGKSTLRYAPGTSDIEEIRFSQILGTSWRTGHTLLAYEYYDRSALKSADRSYTADSDLRPFGGSNHSVISSNPGNITSYQFADGTSQPVQYAIPPGQDGRNLTPEDLLPGVTNLQNIREGTSVLPEQTRHSVLVTANHDVSADTYVFSEGRYSTRDYESRGGFSLSNRLTVPSTNPFFVDPFGGATALRLNYYYNDDYGPQRRYGDVDTINAVVGVVRSLADTWEVELYGSYGTEKTFSASDRFPNTALLNQALADPDPTTAFNPFGDGSHTNVATLAAIEGYTKTNLESDLKTVTLRADGGLFQLGGGAAKLAVGAQFRTESLLSGTTRFTSSFQPVIGPGFDLDRDINSIFAELYLPLITEENAKTAASHLALSVAGRYEDYSDSGESFDPKVGLVWSPIEGMNIRASVGTSFRAPLLTEIGGSDLQILLFNAPDPASPTGTTNMLLLFSNSRPDLEPQEGETWTAGFDFTPRSTPSLTLGLTYFETDVDNLISLPPGNAFSPLLDPVTYAPLIDKGPDGLGPDTTRVAALFEDPAFQGTSIPPEEVGAIVDFRIQNLARTELAGLDLNAQYTLESPAGRFDFHVYASHLLRFRRQLIDGPITDVLDTVTNPVSIRLGASLRWQAGGVQAALIANHIGDYENTRQVPAQRVSSWTTWNLSAGYEFDEDADSFLRNVGLSLHVRNLLNKNPPFVDAAISGVGFDASNADPFGRFASVQLSKSW